MIGRLLATTAALAVLITGATVGLEAVGLLFQGGAPRQAVASIQTQLDPLRDPEAMLLRPLEALDGAQARRQAEENKARRTAADPYDAAREAVDEERYLADALRWAEGYRRRREAQKRVVVLEPPQQVAERPYPVAATDGEWKGPAQDAWAPKVIATVAETEGSSAAHIAEARPPESIAPRSAPRPVHRPSARPHRARSARAGVGCGDGFGCPFPGWLLPLP